MRLTKVAAIAGLAALIASGAQANHGGSASDCQDQFNTIHTDIEASVTSANDVEKMLLKLAAAVAKFEEGKDGDAIQKLEDIAMTVDRLLAGNTAKKTKIDADRAAILMGSLNAAADCIIAS